VATLPYTGDFQISVSHSFPLAALAISKNRVGIDLEKRKEIKKIRHKFILNEDSYIDNRARRLSFLTAIWCVKEALYKIHHSKHWSLETL
jgi:phosphopantetheinyl transferase